MLGVQLRQSDTHDVTIAGQVQLCSLVSQRLQSQGEMRQEELVLFDPPPPPTPTPETKDSDSIRTYNPLGHWSRVVL